MKFHDITECDMLNGDGLRVVLWLSGCEMHCKGCQNQQTWNPDNGVDFKIKAKRELFSKLEKDYISGITFSGGHPLHEANVKGVWKLIKEIRKKYPDKNIWLYTGYTFEDIFVTGLNDGLNNDLPDEVKEIFVLRKEIITNVDVVVDGKYIEKLADKNLHWKGSSNQHVIDVASTNKNIENLGNKIYNMDEAELRNSISSSIVLYD